MKNWFKDWKWYEFLFLAMGELAIILSFVLSPDKNWLSFSSSVLGVFIVMITAKGMVIAPFLSMVFNVLYAINSYMQCYYGETIIYTLMMMPIDIFMIVTWLRNRKPENQSEVSVGKVGVKEYIALGFATVGLTFGFYFLLKALNTSELIVSTISLVTSVLASYLLLRRCAYYAVWYVINDIILIVLWGIAASKDISMLPQAICFVGFLINDAYGFFRWKYEENLQKKKKTETTLPS